MKRSVVKLVSLTLAIVLSLSCLGYANAASARRGNQNYLGTQGALVETPFVSLPPGAVQAREWLLNQLLLQKNGVTGHMHLFNEYNAESSAWLGKSGGEAWERGPYYLRGLVALAYVLDDTELKAEAQLWVDTIIASQQASGYFGPVSDNSWWSRMPVLMALRDYFEATEAKGNPDNRVLVFMEKYFRYQEQQLPTRRLSNWADARGGDNIDSVYWLYNRLYDSGNPDGTKWLLDLGTLLYSQTSDWTTMYNDTTVRQHVVNTSQGQKTPPVYFQFAQQDKYYTALQNGLLNMSIDHGRIDELPNSDEGARDNRSTRGTETCGVVEALLSTEIAERIFGDAALGDRLETIAYNALPATMTPDSTGHTYYVLQNQVMATLGNHGFDNDHGDSSAFGAPLGFDCCFSNYHMGWPKFVQSMWMGTKDNGLALVTYGPNSVKAKVADGKTAAFLQETDYPFKDDVKLTYGGDENVTFELQLRVPSWADGASVKVNGVPVTGVKTGEYYKLSRRWRSGDIVTLNFPSKIKTSTWYNDSVAVEKGALIYGLKIKEDWRTLESNAARELKVVPKPDFPLREVYPASPWNYGLIVNPDNAASSFTVESAGEVALQPFSPDTAPVVLKAKGQLLPEWVLDGNKAGPQPYGPTPYDAALVSDIELIPYGCGRLRISQFPKIGAATDSVVRTTARDGDVVEHNRVKYLEFRNIVVPAADDYSLTIRGSGSGKLILNAKYSQDVNFTNGVMTVTNLKGKLSGYFQFTNNRYNNLRFDTSLAIDSIEVTPVNRTITDVQVLNATRTGDVGKIVTNLDPQETPFKVVYGTESDVYTNVVRSADTATISLPGLDKTKTYFAKVVAVIMGVQQMSAEIKLERTSGSGGLKPNPNVPAARYDGFTTLNYMDSQWKFYDPENKISYSGSNPVQMNFGSGSRVKAALEVDNAYNWVDYVVEAELSVDVGNNNNCGIMFRVTNVGTEPDAYNGYFVGIGQVGSKGKGLMIGYADGGWHDLDTNNLMPIVAGQKYKLKLVVYGERIGVYLDGQLIKTFTDSRFVKGTVGLRSYNEAFKAYNLTVRPIEEEDLTIFETGLLPNPNAPNATYAGLGTVADVAAHWIRYPAGNALINYMDNSGKARIDFGRGTQVKAMLTGASTDPSKWTDYVAEAKLSVDLVNNNNCGMILRGTNVGDGADAYNGYFIGIGYLNVNKIDGKDERYQGPGLMIGYADGGWHDIDPLRADIKPGQIYTLKVVVYGEHIAVYLDDRLVKTLTDTRFAMGSVGLRSYNEAFKAYDLTVRNIVKSDLTVFEEEEDDGPEPPDYTQPNFTEDFEDATAANARWTKVGSTNLISIGSGVISLGSSTNVKATAGQDTWTDFVYEADITLGTGSGNAGLIFRTTRETSGADNYYGYYFGITASGGFEIGRASNGWTQMATGSFDTYAPTNRLKVITYKDKFMFYINNKLVASLTNAVHAAGKIGFRGYNKAFTGDNVLVRPLTEAEFKLITVPVTLPVTISGVSSFNSIQLTYSKMTNASTFKVLYGKQSGVYTGVYDNFIFNTYKSSGPFTADKIAFTVPEAGTWYIRLAAFSGTTQIGLSDEIVVTTGFVKDVTADRAALSTVAETAASFNTAGFSAASLARFTRAKAFAAGMLAAPKANQMDLNLAKCLLTLAMNTPNSQDVVIEPWPEGVFASVTARSGEGYAFFNSIYNNTASTINVACIVAVYDAEGALSDVTITAKAIEARGLVEFTSEGVLPAGGTARAFIWRMADAAFSDNYIPLCDAATTIT